MHLKQKTMLLILYIYIIILFQCQSVSNLKSYTRKNFLNILSIYNCILRFLFYLIELLVYKYIYLIYLKKVWSIWKIFTCVWALLLLCIDVSGKEEGGLIELTKDKNILYNTLRVYYIYNQN